MKIAWLINVIFRVTRVKQESPFELFSFLRSSFKYMAQAEVSFTSGFEFRGNNHSHHLTGILYEVDD